MQVLTAEKQHGSSMCWVCLVTHAWVGLNTITLVLSMLIDKPLSIQNSFKAFRCLCSPSGESEISTISSAYCNICIAIPSRCAPEPLMFEYNYSLLHQNILWSRSLIICNNIFSSIAICQVCRLLVWPIIDMLKLCSKKQLCHNKCCVLKFSGC